MEEIILFLIIFLPTFLIIFFYFLIQENKVKKFQDTLKKFAEEFNFKYIPEPNLFKLIIDSAKKKDYKAISNAILMIVYHTQISAKVRGQFSLEGKTYNIEIGSSIRKLKSFVSVVTYISIEPVTSLKEVFFEITSNDLINKLQELFFKDIQFNIPEFDSNYLVLGNDEEKIKKIIDKNIIKNLLAIHKNAKIYYRSPMLYFEEQDYIDDPTYLKWIFVLMLNILKNIHECAKRELQI